MNIKMILVLVIIALSGCASNFTQNELDDVEYDVEETLRLADIEYTKNKAKCRGIMFIKTSGTRIKEKHRYTAMELKLAECKRR